jgi:hypothetical protein
LIFNDLFRSAARLPKSAARRLEIADAHRIVASMKKMLLVAAIAALATPSWAQMNQATLATDLALVLASEEVCQQPISEAGITSFIEKNVPAEDIEFPNKLMSIVAFQKTMVAKVAGAQKAAHCTQVKRIVQSYGLAG